MRPPLKFGIFLPPFHSTRGNPTLAFRRDLDLIELLDDLGYDEAWFGEHHSGGMELIESPELMVAAAIERTSRIKLGTGVASLSFHHPLALAGRVVQLDHMARGRFMFGVGPGALPSDAHMFGVEVAHQRRRMEESLDAMMHLFTRDEPLTVTTDWFSMTDARLQLRPFSYPLFDVAVTAIASPSGPRLAGRHGAGVLSVGATTAIGFDALGGTWEVLEREARFHGHVPDRSKWRVVAPVHIAETEAQARKDMEYGLEEWCHYFGIANSFSVVGDARTLDEKIDRLNATGFAVIGTPETLRAQIQRVDEQAGGIGAYLCMGHDWAEPAARTRMYELLADEVMPHFQNSLDRRRTSWRFMEEGRDDFMATFEKARQQVGQQYAQEVAEREAVAKT